MNKLLLAGAAAAVIAGGSAIAQTAKPATTAQPAKPPATRHARVMKSETRADLQANVGKMFAKLDTNHDGFIGKDEVDALHAQRKQRIEQRAQRFDPSKIFDRIDANHDGKITAAEAEAAHGQRAQANGGQPAKAQATAFRGLFARADTNKDGAITKAEFDAMGQQVHARMEQAAMAKGPAGRMLDEADTNKDGKVSLAEAQQLALSHFDRMDSNHDGTVTPQERQQARKQFRDQRHPS
jgi:Ca2+-binding EF-hand superfamily protein